MKKLLLLLLLACSFTADAQTLKELLYSGKLKKDSSAIIRKTDDLSSKIDTVQKRPLADSNNKMPVDSLTNQRQLADSVEVERDEEGSSVNETANPVNPAKSNTKIWREYTDSLISSLKTEVLNNRKVKKDTYFFLVNYEIDTNGQVSINSVTVSPENEFLLTYVRERILISPPALNPVMDSSNKPRKVKRRQSFTVVKD